MFANELTREQDIKPASKYEAIIVSLRGAWLGVRAAAPVMAAGGGGSIVSVARAMCPERCWRSPARRDTSWRNR